MVTSLTDILREYIGIKWSEFLRREKDPTLSNSSSVVTNLIRACYKGNLRAIQEGLDRIDGKIAQELEVVFPTFYTVYPYATGKLSTGDGKQTPPSQNSTTSPVASVSPPDTPTTTDDDLDNLPTDSLRGVLNRMLDAPKGVVDTIMTSADLQDNNRESINDPLVSSVMMAGLMRLVHRGRINAVIEVVTQIDGKVKETLKLLGDDVYITSYETTAPAHAIKNDNGVYQVENQQTTTVWGERLESGRGR